MFFRGLLVLSVGYRTLVEHMIKYLCATEPDVFTVYTDVPGTAKRFKTVMMCDYTRFELVTYQPYTNVVVDTLTDPDGVEYVTVVCRDETGRIDMCLCVPIDIIYNQGVRQWLDESTREPLYSACSLPLH